jgi:hypothetical protein
MGSSKGANTPEAQKKIRLIIAAAMVTILWGSINIVLWFRWDADDRLLFINYFSEIKPWLWVALHGRLVVGLFLSAAGVVGLIVRRSKVVLIEGLALFITGGWDIANDFLAIPGLKEYGRVIDSSIVWQDYNVFWLVVGISQIAFTLFFLGSYRRWLKETRLLKSSEETKVTESDRKDAYDRSIKSTP